MAHVPTFVPHPRSDIGGRLESFGPMYTPIYVICRFDFYDLENYKEALSAPKDSLLARKKVLITEMGRLALANK